MSFNQLDSLYRQVIMDHYKNPRNKGVLKDSSLIVDMNNPTCGDRIRLTMKEEDGIIKEVMFEGEGCSISMSSASMMTSLVKGKDVETASKTCAIFSEMIQGREYDASIDLGDIEAFKEYRNFQPE